MPGKLGSEVAAQGNRSRKFRGKKIDITAVSNRKFNNIPLKMIVNCRKKNHKIHWRNEKRIIGFGKGEGTRERFKMGRHRSRHLGSVSRGTAVAHFP